MSVQPAFSRVIRGQAHRDPAAFREGRAKGRPDSPIPELPSLWGVWIAAGVLSVVLGAWLLEGIVGPSEGLAQAIGVGTLAAICLGIVAALWKDPGALVSPGVVLGAGCIYLFVLDMALLRRMEGFPLRVVFLSETLGALFVALAFLGWSAFRPKRSPLAGLLRWADFSLKPGLYFWAALLTFGMEYAKRLLLANGNFALVVEDLLASRSVGLEGNELHSGPVGDWRGLLFFTQTFFLLVPFCAMRAWTSDLSFGRKAILAGVVALNLVTLVLEGARGSVLQAIGLPLMVRFIERRGNLRRLLAGTLAGLIVLTPLTDFMVSVRGYGWEAAQDIERPELELGGSKRDDNLYWIANLVDSLERDGGVESHQGPIGFLWAAGEIGKFVAITFVPRVFWPGKPDPRDLGDDTRSWWASRSIVGDLVGAGGLSGLFVGAFVFGLGTRWLLGPLYPLPKREGAMLCYAYLLLLLQMQLRAVTTYQAGLVILAILIVSCGALRMIVERKRRAEVP
ncbi:hypothetical protein [Methylacidimicrobium sp. B4]|uniref:hypothetical protein n=1 Tax=Methylacidimicrobium sp. B4 TaxID=2796139 RepID=UPI001A8CEB74|nr:hypothetical protein [Methylacidimicrobium sp. B4]QSR85453.1 hypothetical protein MacB4_04265 [Methylacidimicrobium sp. B4]